MAESVTVYTLGHCPFCVKAKDLLSTHQISYREARVADDDKNARADLEKTSGMKTSLDFRKENKN